MAFSRQDRPIHLYRFGKTGQTIFIFGGIHGDEQASCVLADALTEFLSRHPDLYADRQILVIARLNPDGIVANSRLNANGIDLNRNFPTDNRIDSDLYGYEPLSEPESKFLHDFVQSHRPARILSIHQPLACVDYDGPAEALAEQMSQYCALPAQKLGARPGSFGSFAGEMLNIPTVTLELERNDDLLTQRQIWEKYGLCVVSFIVYPESLDSVSAYFY